MRRDMDGYGRSFEYWKHYRSGDRHQCRFRYGYLYGKHDIWNSNPKHLHHAHLRSDAGCEDSRQDQLKTGDTLPQKPLTEEQVESVRRLLSARRTREEVAHELGISLWEVRKVKGTMGTPVPVTAS